MDQFETFMNILMQRSLPSMPERLASLGKFLRHAKTCENSDCCLCRGYKESIENHAPQWAVDLATAFDKRPDVQLRAMMEDWSADKIAEELGVDIDEKDAT